MSTGKANLWRFPLQGFNYAVFMAVVWYFSAAPSVQVLSDNESVITIAFAHAGKLLEPCRKLTSEELAELAQNMRAMEDCPRARSPVLIRAELGGNTIYDATLEPPGLFNDGGVDVFHSEKIPAGRHNLTIKMNDSVNDTESDYVLDQVVNVVPGQILLVGFETEKGFILE